MEQKEESVNSAVFNAACMGVVGFVVFVLGFLIGQQVEHLDNIEQEMEEHYASTPRTTMFGIDCLTKDMISTNTYWTVYDVPIIEMDTKIRTAQLRQLTCSAIAKVMYDGFLEDEVKRYNFARDLLKRTGVMVTFNLHDISFFAGIELPITE
jgi:hypothetical protein